MAALSPLARGAALRAGPGLRYNPAMLLATLVAVATAFPQTQDPFVDLVARAAATKRLRAEYELVLGEAAERSVLTLEYLAPDRMRLEQRRADRALDYWIVDGVISLRSTMKGPSRVFQFDCGAFLARWRATEDRARASAPALAAHWQPNSAAKPVFQLQWGFDAKSNQAIWDFDLGYEADASSPFGWLEIARQKQGVAWTRDGDLLRAETDGRFVIAIAATGMLQELIGRNEKGEVRVAMQLRSATFDEDPPAARFEPPVADEATLRASAEFEREQDRSARSTLRMRTFRAYVAARAAAADAAAAAKVDADAKPALRVFLEDALASQVEQFLRANAESSRELAQRVARAAAGGSPDQVAALRAKATKAVADGMQEQADRFVTLDNLPGNHPRAADFHALEQAVVATIYRERVVEVVLADFETACDEALR
jgi:outer membrane lipoprotein-sorting protein